MKSVHIYSFVVGIVGLIVFLVGMDIVSIQLIASVIVGVAVLGGISYGANNATSFLGVEKETGDLHNSSTPGSGSHYDTAIEPDEAWRFVNERIDELEYAPYRKIDTDTSNLRKNDVTGQSTIKATIDGKETRITMIKGKPINPRKGEIIAYIIDLAKPSIHDWKGGLRGEEEKKDPFNGKYGFYIRKGNNQGNNQSAKNESDGSPLVEVNEGGKDES